MATGTPNFGPGPGQTLFVNVGHNVCVVPCALLALTGCIAGAEHRQSHSTQFHESGVFRGNAMFRSALNAVLARFGVRYTEFRTEVIG